MPGIIRSPQALLVLKFSTRLVKATSDSLIHGCSRLSSSPSRSSSAALGIGSAVAVGVTVGILVAVGGENVSVAGISVTVGVA